MESCYRGYAPSPIGDGPYDGDPRSGSPEHATWCHARASRLRQPPHELASAATWWVDAVLQPPRDSATLAAGDAWADEYRRNPPLGVKVPFGQTDTIWDSDQSGGDRAAGP